MSDKEAILLSDEQMRQFIVDGYLEFTPSVPEGIHQTIYQKLCDTLDRGANPGNNVLPQVPEMRHILNSPEVRGALISVLGQGYIEHPHRYCHHLGAAAEKLSAEEAAAKLAKNSHQDGYTPLGRPRQHYPRFARIMYYPQDTPVELGPTHVIAGTQYNKGLTDEDRQRNVPWVGKAGTVTLTHFDVGHAAGVNLLDRRRHMIKFIYVRATEPTEPSWDCRDSQWRRPQHIETPFDLELAWSHVWDWLCGKRQRYDSWQRQALRGDVGQLIGAMAVDRDVATRLAAIQGLAAGGAAAHEAIPALVGMLGTEHQAVRTAAIYTLGALGEPAVVALVENLRAAGRREDKHDVPEPWSEGATNMEDAANALAAVGEPAVAATAGELASASEWTRINAAYALGEMDSHAVAAVPQLLKSLDDVSHRVVRTALDALSSIRRNVPVAEVARLLEAERPGWDEALTRDWSGRDQVRINAAMACTRLGVEAAAVEEMLISALDDPCGHVGTFAMDALKRIGSPTADQAVVDYLLAQRWDGSILSDRQF